jgi:hypothetical protein
MDSNNILSHAKIGIFEHKAKKYNRNHVRKDKINGRQITPIKLYHYKLTKNIQRNIWWFHI